MEERVRSFLAEYGLIFLLAGAGVIFLVFGIFQLNSPSQSVVLSSDTTSEPQESLSIYVDIGGAVAQPGVYSVPDDSRIADVITKAGGVTDDADIDYIERVLNKAQLVKDGQKIFVPSINQAVAGSTTREQSESASSSLIDINTASATQLDSLPGVGEVTAEKIISNRPYSSVDELKVKKAVSSATYEKIKDSVTVY